MLSRFRIMAMSMQRLQVRYARIAVVPIDMVHLDAVVMLEEQSTVTTPAPLCFEQPGYSWTDTRVSSLSCAPVHPIAVIGTAIALDFDMSGNRHLTVRPKARRFWVSRRGGTGQTRAQPMSVPSDGPGSRFPRMSPACPGLELDPGEMVEPMIHGLPHTGAVVIRGVP
jgi:hypothetical protein